MKENKEPFKIKNIRDRRFFFQYLLSTAEWPRRGAGILPPAVILIHWLFVISNSNKELIDTGFNVSCPVGSVTSCEYTTPPIMRMYLFEIIVAVWSILGEGLFSTIGLLIIQF